MGIESAIKIVELLNAAAPGVAELIIMIRRPNGTLSVVALLDEADARFAENIKQAQDWLKANPKG